MSKDQILSNADACAREAESLRKEIEVNEAKIKALIDREQRLRKEAAEYSSPERVFLDIIDGCTIKIDKDKYPDSIFLFKGNYWMFEIEKSIVWCRWDKVWDKISVAISGDYAATQAFIKDRLEQHFKMMGVTPILEKRPTYFLLEQHFKMMGVTPGHKL